MFLNKYGKNNVYPIKPQFYCIKVEFKGIKTILACFREEVDNPITKTLLNISLTYIIEKTKNIV